MNFAEMPSSHFLFIPTVLLIGIVIGWVLGSRAARDAYAAELRRREEKARRGSSGPSGPSGPSGSTGP
jgi:hypothetical protein